MTDLQSAIDELRGARRIALATHRGPDGDAIGSSLALCLLLLAQGKDARLYVNASDIGTPRILEGLDLIIDPKLAQTDCATRMPDILVCLDCASPDRISVPFFRDNISRFRVLNIDHHGSNPRFGAVNLVVDGASSTGELVWNMAKSARWQLDRRAAEAIWVAVTTDTGRFSYSSTGPSTLECGADLLRHGVRKDWLNDEIFSKCDLKVMRLRARAYSSIDVWFGGKVATITLDAPDYAACGCAKADSDDFVDIPRAVRGTVLAVFFYRSLPDEHSTHLSIRAREPFDACALAACFGGGGHRLAAGATVDCGIDEAKTRVRERLSAMFGEDADWQRASH